VGTYYVDAVGDDGVDNAHVSADLATPAKHANSPTLAIWDLNDMIWVGIKLSCSNCGKTTVPTTVTLEVKKDAGSWLTLVASECAMAGTANMNYTDLTPPNTAWFTANNTGLCLNDATDGYAHDSQAAQLVQVSTKGDRFEVWWAIDLSGCASGSTYYFGVWDSQGNIGTVGSPLQLAVSVDVVSAGIDLVVNNAYHENVPSELLLLTQKHILEQDADNFHPHDVDDLILLTQKHILTLADCFHLNEVIPTDLTLAISTTLTITPDPYHAVEDEGPVTLTQKHILTVVDCTHDLFTTPTDLDLSQKHILTVADGPHDHAVTPTDLTLEEVHYLTVASAGSDIFDDGPVTITQAVGLTVNDCYHETQDGGPITLLQIHALLVADCFSLLEDVGPLALIQKHILTCADCENDVIDSGPITLTSEGVVDLVVADSFHLTEDPGPLALIQEHELIVAGSGHDVESPQINLTSGLDLAVQDAFHENLPSAIGLTQKHILTVASASHAHDGEGDLILTVLGAIDLVVAACEHILTDDLSAITQLHILTVDSCEDAVISAQITITHIVPSALGDIVDPSIWSRTVERYLVSLTTERTIHHS
jgi:hypothetical protein